MMNASTNHALGLLTIALALGFGAYWISYKAVDVGFDPESSDLGLLWLKSEYQLDDATFSKVSALHTSYYRECEQRCHLLETVNNQLLKDAVMVKDLVPAVEAELAKEDALCHDCRQAMLKHLYAVAHLMPAEAGKRFIAEMTPLVLPAAVHGQRKALTRKN
jgi:hypothetical protein